MLLLAGGAGNQTSIYWTRRATCWDTGVQLLLLQLLTSLPPERQKHCATATYSTTSPGSWELNQQPSNHWTNYHLLSPGRTVTATSATATATAKHSSSRVAEVHLLLLLPAHLICNSKFHSENKFSLIFWKPFTFYPCIPSILCRTLVILMPNFTAEFIAFYIFWAPQPEQVSLASNWVIVVRQKSHG